MISRAAQPGLAVSVAPGGRAGKAFAFCNGGFKGVKLGFNKVKRRSWGVPDAWDMRGRCK